MKKLILFCVLVAGMTAVAARAQGLGGDTGDGPCDSSPENPTLLLAAIGSTGAGLAVLRTRLSARKKK